VNALERWRAELAGWAIPDEILAAAPESPWGFPTELFRTRAERPPADPSATTRVALDALGSGGDVLDVGVGGGATSLPLAALASRITGVDESTDMLAGFLGSARDAGVEATGVEGRWPDASADAPAADIVVCGHVLYNVGDLEPFMRALDAHARKRVVVEITSSHPLVWMGDLWRRFHGLARPTGPTADLAVDAIRELGIEVGREDEARASRSGGFERREDAVAFIRRRLCLSADRDAEVAEALGEGLAERDGLWTASPVDHPIATLWWDRSAS
jgi:SAM-dependent methyltransferase